MDDFDALQIALNYTVFDRPFSVTFAELEHYGSTSTIMGMMQGFGIGCSVVLSFVSWCSISNKKTPVFILNQICLFLLAVRSVLFMVYLRGPLNSLAFLFTGILKSYSAFRVSVAVSAIYVCLIVAVECLLVFQVYVMFKSCNSRIKRLAVLAFSCALAAVVVVIYIVQTTFSLQNSWAQLNGHKGSAMWRANLPFILFCASINFLSVLLVGKLLMAIHLRRHLGLKQFNPLHVLLIMTLQTCIIPSAMAIYNYSLTERSPVYFNLSIIMVVCNMPFSSLWASTANISEVPNSCQNSVFSRISSNDSRDSSETLAFSFRSKAVQKSPFSEKDNYPHSAMSVGSDGDYSTINRMYHEINMHQRV